MEKNLMYNDFKEEQEKYRHKTAKNKFSKEDMNAGKAVRKDRESDTMAMLSGFKNVLFQARKGAKNEGEKESSGRQIFIYIHVYMYTCIMWK